MHGVIRESGGIVGVVLEIYAGWKGGTRYRVFDPRDPYSVGLYMADRVDIVGTAVDPEWHVSAHGDTVLLGPEAWQQGRLSWEELSFARPASPGSIVFKIDMNAGRLVDMPDGEAVRTLFRVEAAKIIDRAGFDGALAFTGGDDLRQFRTSECPPTGG